MISGERVLGGLRHEFFQEGVCLLKMPFPSRQGNSQGKHVGSFEMVLGELEKKTGGFRKIIEREGSFDRGEVWRESLRFWFLVKNS